MLARQGKLIEVNVLSPGTIKDINKLNNTKLQRKIIDYLERVVDEEQPVDESVREGVRGVWICERVLLKGWLVG